jgi:glutaredoxin
MATLIMYTLRTCPTCERARRDLTAEGVDFEERCIDDNGQWFEEASQLAITVPIIVRGDKVEVGWKGESG